ncbi:MAG: hypothetical protein A2W18_05635 [Candidatus Muproteobacteria bacterium RBG_16_60_9]|uniref:Uncharacterized protein n=1 Tax=Candidatus Muproteobacteria bacterium RBG_16_60_9 TaxID=1817755 RepID=A0A1F6V5J7_9PROT|nr:MAG: hypothetical protein A2W18_05635 [Candidatus Muproteobacteria bacterium RBG_16_60_9]
MLNAGQMGAVDEIGLNHQVLIDEVGTVSVVGVDTANLRSRDENIVWSLCCKKLMYGSLIQQVKFCPCTRS